MIQCGDILDVNVVLADGSEFSFPSSRGDLSFASDGSLVQIALNGQTAFRSDCILPNSIVYAEFTTFVNFSDDDGAPIDQIKDFCMLTKPIIHDERKTNQWIKSVAGPLPAKKMPCRVVQLINAVINDKTL